MSEELRDVDDESLLYEFAEAAAGIDRYRYGSAQKLATEIRLMGETGAELLRRLTAGRKAEEALAEGRRLYAEVQREEDEGWIEREKALNDWIILNLAPAEETEGGIPR